MPSDTQRRNINLLPIRPDAASITPDQLAPLRGAAGLTGFPPGAKDRLTREQLMLSRNPAPLQNSGYHLNTCYFHQDLQRRPLQQERKHSLRRDRGALLLSLVLRHWPAWYRNRLYLVPSIFRAPAFGR